MKNRYAWLKSLLAGDSLTTRFAVYSFVCIGLMTVVLWLIVSNYLRPSSSPLPRRSPAAAA